MALQTLAQALFPRKAQFQVRTSLSVDLRGYTLRLHFQAPSGPLLLMEVDATLDALDDLGATPLAVPGTSEESPARLWPSRTAPGRPTDQEAGKISPRDMQRLYEKTVDAFGESVAWELFGDVIGRRGVRRRWLSRSHGAFPAMDHGGESPNVVVDCQRPTGEPRGLVETQVRADHCLSPLRATLSGL